jgi:carboxymethylenebutenolidase
MARSVPITQAMIELYDEYTHVTLDRRRFMTQLTRLCGGAAAACAALPLLEANPALAALVAPDDPRLKIETVRFDGTSGPVSGYWAQPAKAAGKLPAVLVIHENRGLNPHIQDVVRRAALAGFVALGPDFLSPSGGTPADQNQARQMIYQLDPEATVGDAVAAVAFLKSDAASTGKVGAVGFCWGGGMVNQTAIHAPDLGAGVAFYGRVPASADVAKIRAKMLLHYAGLDQRINAGIAGYKAALEAAKVEHTIHMYDGVNHAFHNDTAAARYHKAAAGLAWKRTIEFLTAALAS